jgi:hypothetical protein
LRRLLPGTKKRYPFSVKKDSVFYFKFEFVIYFNEMRKKKKFRFLNHTLKFSIAGLFIPGFTAILIFGSQMGITFLGIECSDTWMILWTLTSIGAVVAPIIFVRFLYHKLSQDFNLTFIHITVFNIIEYVLLQCALASFFTNGRILCYETDGQNGLEFVFTGWLTIPFLIILSLIFDFLRKRKIGKLSI